MPKRLLIVANHLSFLDPILIGLLFLPKTPMFAVDAYIARRWYLKPFFKLTQIFLLNPNSPMSIKAIIKEIKQDKQCVIFPEGRISVTGVLMKVYDGTGLIADRAHAAILPIHIDGTQYSLFSRLKGKVRRRLFPKVRITIGQLKTFELPDSLKGRKRREAATTELYDIMSNMAYVAHNTHQCLFDRLIDSMRIYGRGQIIVEDLFRKPITYGDLVTRSFILGRQLAKNIDTDHVGVLLPNTLGNVVTFFALSAYGRVPVMLNFSTGYQIVLSACRTAGIDTVISARAFVENANLFEMIDAIQAQHIKIIYLEDVATTISFADKLVGLVCSLMPRYYYRRINHNDAQQPAVILFTSGSEGAPKGVVLSHSNIHANHAQLSARIDFAPPNIVFNVLPMFHSFGLLAGTLLPIMNGMRFFLYTSPLHYRQIPELIYDTKATIMFGTDTFLSGYARYANPYDFHLLRYVFAGAEKLKQATRQQWFSKFGLRIFEGYGVTETAPALAVNTRMHYKDGTVGRLLPGISYRLIDIPGIEDAGRLVVSGDNIMLGYLFADNPNVLVPAEHKEHDTGDIASVDEDKYVIIRGRAKRFAKIAGEMVSLTAVEDYLMSLWSDYQHAVVSVPDKRKGEALLLVTTYSQAKRKDIVTYVKQHGIGELLIPRHIQYHETIPLLATGKIDYPTLEKQLSS